MAVPKPQKPSYRDSSVQARQGIQKTTQVTPILYCIFLFPAML